MQLKILKQILVSCYCKPTQFIKIQDDSKRWTQLKRKRRLNTIRDSNVKCSSSLEVECWNEDETHAARQSPTEF